MATSILPARYKINGILDTKVPVMTNLETLCNSCGSFMSYDIHTGEWSVVINTTGASVKSFSNANIIGPIQVSGTSLQNLFNRVRVEFPLRDTSDGIDFIEIEIPVIDRYPNEPDNTLQMTLQMCNEPVQATIIGLIELKQSRIDQIITFISDYSTLSLNAGDIIDVTNDIYQFSAKPFRIISIKELDTESGSIQIEITALAYDANVYSTADLGRFIRTDRNGIVGIGSISAPLTPTLTNLGSGARPRVLIETVVPAGIVESMEFWISTDNTNFTLIGTQSPTGGGTFSSGDTVTQEYNQVASANYFAKTRGINSTTAGPYSPVVSLIGFVAQQIPQALDANTGVLSSGSNILTTVSLTTLLGALNSLIRDNSAAAGGIYEKVFSVLSTETGADLTAGTAFVGADVGTVNSTISQSSSISDDKFLGSTVFVAPVSGLYKSDMVFDQNTSGAKGGRGNSGGWGENLDYIAVFAELTVTSTGALVFEEGSGGAGAQFWTDFLLTNLSSLTEGVSYTLSFYAINYTESVPGNTANFTVGWSVFTVG